MFMICPKCDFEWHKQDGEFCPICAKESIKKSHDQMCQDSALKPSTRMVFDSKRLWVQALAIISIVSLLVLWATAG